jgi:Lrp/AsnC family transcriptional regulator for asnA, asnC and gidA
MFLCRFIIVYLIYMRFCGILEEIYAKTGEDFMGLEDLSDRANIDEIDLQIIKILNDDGRAPFAQIANALGVSPGMIRQRYNRLVEEGVVQVVAITNPMLMGFSTMAQIGVKVNVNRLQEIADQIISFDEVIYLVLVTGSYDLFIEVVCRDRSHLLDFLTNRLHSVEGVKEAETFIFLRIAKEAYTWAGIMGDT